LVYIENQHPINALNAICLNSFRIRSAQSRPFQAAQLWNSLPSHVTLLWAWLVLGWVAVWRSVNHFGILSLTLVN